MKNLFLFILMQLSFSARSQINQVRNPSFEDYSTCPDGLDELTYSNYWVSLDSGWRAPDWAHLVNGGVPEYCNICAPLGAVSIPLSAYYYHYPRTGNGFVQLRTFHDKNDTNTVARDYLQGHLDNNLLAGHNYLVSYYVVGEYSQYFAQNHIDAYLDDGAIDSVTPSHGGWVQSQYTPQIVDSAILNDTTNWTKIEGTYTANGSERFITIGNFTPNSSTSLLRLLDTTGASGFIYLLYLIDDVSVIDCSNIPFAGNDTLIMPGDSVYLGPHESLLPYTWYQLGSSTAIDSGSGIMVRPTTTTRYVLKQDLCGKAKFDTVAVHVWPDTVVDTPNSVVRLAPLEDVVLYPNPVSTSLNIDGAKGCSILMSNILGRVVLRKENCNKRERLDVGDLLPGVYSVEVIDKVSGYRVVRMETKE